MMHVRCLQCICHVFDKIFEIFVGLCIGFGLGLNLDDTEVTFEGDEGWFSSLDEIVRVGHLEAGMLGGNFKEDNWRQCNWSFKSFESFWLIAFIFRYFGADISNLLVEGFESYDVWELLKDRNILLWSTGVILSGIYKIHDGFSFEKWELYFKNIDAGNGKISELDLVG